MGLKIIGAGFGRTGTLSLKFALEKLGFDKCYHMMEVEHHPEHVQQWINCAGGQEPDWRALFQGFQASVDWPSCNYWRQQWRAFPDAKILLSRRDPEAWHRSVMNTIWPISKSNSENPHPRAQQGWQMANAVIWQGVFDGRIEDKAYAIKVFEAHNQAVIDSVPAEQLLVYEPGEGWGPLCEFLDCEIPAEPYPKTNSTAEFKSFWEAQRAKAKDQNPS
ncbi:MAG: sulfotransferase family protein [Pseudomonadota bacterium]